MVATRVDKVVVIEMKFTFGLFGCKTRSSCVHNKTAKKKSFKSFFVWDVTCKCLQSSLTSTQQITNLIKYRVATGVTPTYNTTNTTNEILSHQFMRNVSCTLKLQKLFWLSADLLYTQLLVLHPNNPNTV